MPALEPLPNLGSQIDRAIVAYLISVGAGTEKDTYPANRSFAKELPNTVVRSFASEHDVDDTGNEVFKTSIQSKFPARVQPATRNKKINMTQMDRRIGLIKAAILQSGETSATCASLDYTAGLITAAGRALAVSDPENNADMADFTLQKLYFAGSQRGEPDDNSGCWVEGILLKITACSSALS